MAAHARLGSCSVVFWSVYLRPGAQAQLLTQLNLAVPVTHPLLAVVRQVILGDFNLAQADRSEAAGLWTDLCDKLGFVEPISHY